MLNFDLLIRALETGGPIGGFAIVFLAFRLMKRQSDDEEQRDSRVEVIKTIGEKNAEHLAQIHSTVSQNHALLESLTTAVAHLQGWIQASRK